MDMILGHNGNTTSLNGVPCLSHTQTRPLFLRWRCSGRPVCFVCCPCLGWGCRVSWVFRRVFSPILAVPFGAFLCDRSCCSHFFAVIVVFVQRLRSLSCHVMPPLPRRQKAKRVAHCIGIVAAKANSIAQPGVDVKFWSESRTSASLTFYCPFVCRLRY